MASLPSLTLGEKPELSFLEMQELLALNLSLSDLEQVTSFRRSFDLRNIRAMWLRQPLDEWGNWGAKEIEEELLVQGGMPLYVVEFLERYSSQEERLRYFTSLYASLYREEGVRWGGFLQNWYQSERAIRLIITALRSKHLKRDVGWEMQFEDVSDPLVKEILAQKDAPEYIPPKEFEDLKVLFRENVSEPQKLEKALLRYRFDQIEEMEGVAPFTVDRVLGYLARLRIAGSYFALQQHEDVRALFAS